MNTSTRHSANATAFDISQVLTPDAFSHRVDGIALKETHLSWIVLTGTFAYKIKKPVRLDFIDAATLEQRRHLCEEEVRLNRRLAPELYVDVLPIAEHEGGLRFGGRGKTIEYAVRMRQFAVSEELHNLLEARRISVGEIAALGELLSSFYARAPSARNRSGFPLTNQMVDTVLGNVAGLIAHLQEAVPAVHLGHIPEWLTERLERDRSLFEQRERCGYVRECHGDLHAGNIVRSDGRLLPFDCLEFDPRLRWIDILDDLAFLLMDLASHGRADLMMVLLSRYLECSGDYAGLPLLPVYAVHRALVRANIDALSIRSVPHRAAEFRERLQRRLHAAVHWTRSKQPTLILMHGASGSGKSWLSERLIDAVPALRIRSDLERKRLAGVAADERAAARIREGIYTPAFSHRTYAQLSDCAEASLRTGFNTIVDATFLDASDRELFRGLAARLGTRFVIVGCVASRDELSRRIRKRAATGERTSDADLAVLDAQLKSLQPFLPQETAHVIEIDTSETDAIERAMVAIRACHEVPHQGQ